MDGVGKRLRARALDLGLSDAEVARRAGLTATRYGHYVSDYREPDLATLVRICRVLGLRPDELLAYEQLGGAGDEVQAVRCRLIGFAQAMDIHTLGHAEAVMHALAASAALKAGPRIRTEQGDDGKKQPGQAGHHADTNKAAAARRSKK